MSLVDVVELFVSFLVSCRIDEIQGSTMTILVSLYFQPFLKLRRIAFTLDLCFAQHVVNFLELIRS